MRWTVFVRSTKAMHIGRLCSRHFSCSYWTENIISIVDILFLRCYFYYVSTFLLQLSGREYHVYRISFVSSWLFLLCINISFAAVGQRITCLSYLFCFFVDISIIYQHFSCSCRTENEHVYRISFVSSFLFLLHINISLAAVGQKINMSIVYLLFLRSYFYYISTFLLQLSERE